MAVSTVPQKGRAIVTSSFSVELAETFAAARTAVDPSLRTAVATMDPSSAAIGSYHFGWTQADGSPAPSGGEGKSLRPSLALIGAQAGGASMAPGVPGAVAVELVHNFSLLHDDVIDRDTERRHRPTAWVVWSAADAILAGDAMLTLAQQVLLQSGSPHTVAALELLLRATQRVIHGQFLDLEFEKRQDVTLEACLTMAKGKTSSLLSASAAIGAVLAGAPAQTVAVLAEYGEQVGTAFQIIDDLLGIWGDPAVTGKPVLSDLRSRKKTLPMTYAVTSGSTFAPELARWLAGTTESSETELVRAAQLVQLCGGRKWAADEARAQVTSAQALLDTIELPARVRSDLVDLANFVVSRDV
jgi:geranylgeranyl diphosphate synthase type I